MMYTSNPGMTEQQQLEGASMVKGDKKALCFCYLSLMPQGCCLCSLCYLIIILTAMMLTYFFLLIVERNHF